MTNILIYCFTIRILKDRCTLKNKKKDMSDIKERNINLSEKREDENKKGVESGFFLKCCSTCQTRIEDWSMCKNKQMGRGQALGTGQCGPAHALRWTREEQREALHKVLNILSASTWQYVVQMA